jgi:hypothetical protein
MEDHVHICLIAVFEAPNNPHPIKPYIEFVSLPFSKLKHFCRFNKGGCCKKIRGFCEAQKCPEIPKEK